MMEKKLLVTVSIILNLVFIVHILYNNFIIWSPTWTYRAAGEAETVAFVSCSGHGRAFVDGLGVLDGHKPPCECNNCYTGTDCSILLQDCPVNANSGDPLFLEPFWMRQAEKSAVLVSGWHMMSYIYQDGTFVSRELEKVIRKLHSVVGNAVTDNRFIIFGSGSTQLLAAAVHALSLTNSSSPARLLTSVPYEALYGRPCRTPLCWTQVGERSMLGADFVQKTTEKIRVLKLNMREAQDRQKSYADKRRKDIEFEVGIVCISRWRCCGVLTDPLQRLS